MSQMMTMIMIVSCMKMMSHFLGGSCLIDMALSLSLRTDIGHVDVAERSSWWKTVILLASSVFLDCSEHKRKKTLHLRATSGSKEEILQSDFNQNARFRAVSFAELGGVWYYIKWKGASGTSSLRNFDSSRKLLEFVHKIWLLCPA